MPSTPPNKTALLIRNAFSYDFGGGERFPVDLAAALGKYGWQTIVMSRSPKLLDYAEQSSISHRRGKWWSKQNWSGRNVLLFPVYLVWQCILTAWYYRTIANINPRVVHIQSKDDFVAATLAARLLRRRVVWTDHADLKYIYANHGVWYKNPVGKLVFWASRYADAITLVSESERQLVGNALGQSLSAKYVVIHNGVIDTTVTPYADKPVGSFVFCATSRLVTAKGIGELLDAFKTFRQQHMAAELWLVGDGPGHTRFKKEAADMPGVTFFGHQDNPLQFVAACDVFVHPSYHEGFSISLVEAAMLAKPIIACNVGGNPEIVKDGETGLLVHAKNSAALQTAMERLYGDSSLRQKLAASARTLYEKQFRFDQIVAQQFIPLYENTRE